jgi:hypothetical protein
MSAQEFRQACQDKLGFLHNFGFSDAQLDGPPLCHSITARFYGKSFAIECIWDEREKSLEVKVARLQGGKPPTEFAVDPQGKRVRDHLIQILIRRGVRTFPFQKISSNAPLEEVWRAHLDDYAQLLQQHGSDVLREAPDVLD